MLIDELVDGDRVLAPAQFAEAFGRVRSDPTVGRMCRRWSAGVMNFSTVGHLGCP
jgi:hypothetical protein